MSAFYFGFSAATISGVQAVMLITAGLLSAALAFITNWLALIPWRRAKGQHWSERARLYFPVRVAAAFSVLIFLNPWRLNPRFGLLGLQIDRRPCVVNVSGQT